MGENTSLGQSGNPLASTAEPQSEKLPPFNVVLLDDDHHTYDYVIVMLRKVFGYAEERARQMTVEVDTRKRVIVFTSHKELAELKREQMLSFGADPTMDNSAGPMSVVLEPAA